MSPNAEGGPPLANMSAPPRSVVVVTPFRARTLAPAGVLTNWGLAWRTRVCFDLNLQALWPEWAQALDPDDRSGLDKAHLRLCGAVALALGTRPEALAASLDETLVDDLMRVAPELTGGLLLATPARDAVRPLEPDPLRALAILTHLSGRTCDPGGSPLFSEALREGRTIDLWTAEADHA